MFLQAVSDDSMSQSGQQRLYLAGYLNHTDQWRLFTDAWAEELAASPSISYLKMAEAQNLKGQFRHWTEEQKDEKLKSLARVIRHFRPMSFEISVSVKDFDELVKSKAPYGLATPYLPCLFGVVSSVSRIVHKEGSNLPVGFIFDEQNGVGSDFLQFFPHMIRNLPAGARKLIKAPPEFKDDKTYLPLQAADMLAWHIRREHDDGLPPFGMPMAEHIRGEYHLVTEISRDMLESWGNFFATQRGITLIQTKSQWRKFRSTLKSSLEFGYIPPHGTRLKNFLHGIRDRIIRIFYR